MLSTANFVTAFYVVLPLVGLAVAAILAKRQKTFRPLGSFGVSLFSSFLISLAINLAYARALDGSATVGQVLLTTYLLTGVLCALKLLSWGLKEGAERLFVVHVRQSVGKPKGVGWAARLAGATVLRVLVLFGLGLPYIMSIGMVYRPKAVGGENPRHQLGTTFEDVSFRSMDDIKLAGWWIPAAPPPPSAKLVSTQPATRPSDVKNPAPAANDWGAKTVILCHGVGASKSNQLLMVRDLVMHGYNVLAFDFRAHGNSGGQLCSFGDRERYDVLGAVRWLRTHRPQQSAKIVGLGVSMGGAALLAAAGEDSAEGRAIDAVAVFSTYDHLAKLADGLTEDHFIAPIGYLARKVGLSLASLHVGSDLSRFSPAEATDRIAPRPIMVVHGRGDHLIPFETGVRLFERAQVPKVRLWVGELSGDHYVIRTNARYRTDQNGEQQLQPAMGPPADHNNLIFYDDGLKAVRLFFDQAKSMT